MGEFYKCFFQKVESNHNNLRTNSMEGVAQLPKVGETFSILGEGLDFGVRNIHTTEIKEIKKIKDNTLQFKTRNSTYDLVIKEKIGDSDKLHGYLEEVDKGDPSEGNPPKLFVVSDELLMSLMGKDGETEH